MKYIYIYIQSITHLEIFCLRKIRVLINKFLLNYSFQIFVLLPLPKEFFQISLLTQFRHLSANVIFIKASNRKLVCLAYSTSNLFANTKL